MRLYATPGTASLAPQIILREAGLTYETVRLGVREKTLPDGRPFTSISPKGYVPALELDDGSILTEGPAVLLYLADLKPQLELAPPHGTMERYRAIEWLSFTASELHKSYTPLFLRGVSDGWKAAAQTSIERRLAWIAAELTDREWLCERFGVADAYLFTVLNWTQFTAIPIDGWPSLVTYLARVAARPAVHAALVADGMIK